jgi:hypothetical protein
MAAGATINAAPAELSAQGRSSNTSTLEQIRAAEREAERERLRSEREREQERQMRTSTVRGADARRIDERDARRDDRAWGDIYDAKQNRNGNGPAFCRSGQGHPVHGREWCRDKGWGLGAQRDVFGDIIFRQPKDRRYEQRTLGRGTLGDILGGVVLGRFERIGRYYGSAPMTGHWIHDYGVRTLQLNVGALPIARLVDVNRDGRVDEVVLRR